MDSSERIRKIEEFVHLQRYIHGLMFHVLEDPGNEDGFIIEFATATPRQLASLNQALQSRQMGHIRCKAQDVVKQINH